MNQFQKYFVESFRAMCSMYKIGQCDFEKIQGQTEIYFVSKFALNDKKFEVYLYDESAGFYCDGKWCIPERADHPTDDQLFSAFKRLFERELNAPKKSKQN